MPRIVLYLASKIGHAECHSAFVRFLLGAPRSARQIVHRNNASGRLNESRQHPELDSRQVHTLTALLDPHRAQVDRQYAIVVARLHRVSTLAAPCLYLDARYQFPYPERLDHIVVGAGVQSADDVLLLAQSRDDDDGHPADRSQASARFPPIHIGQAHVQENDVVRRLAGHGEALRCGHRDGDAVARSDQMLAQHPRERRFFVDDQDSHSAFLASAPLRPVRRRMVAYGPQSIIGGRPCQDVRPLLRRAPPAYADGHARASVLQWNVSNGGHLSRVGRRFPLCLDAAHRQ